MHGKNESSLGGCMRSGKRVADVKRVFVAFLHTEMTKADIAWDIGGPHEKRRSAEIDGRAEVGSRPESAGHVAHAGDAVHVAVQVGGVSNKLDAVVSRATEVNNPGIVRLHEL